MREHPPRDDWTTPKWVVDNPSGPTRMGTISDNGLMGLTELCWFYPERAREELTAQQAIDQYPHLTDITLGDTWIRMLASVLHNHACQREEDIEDILAGPKDEDIRTANRIAEQVFDIVQRVEGWLLPTLPAVRIENGGELVHCTFFGNVKRATVDVIAQELKLKVTGFEQTKPELHNTTVVFKAPQDQPPPTDVPVVRGGGIMNIEQRREIERDIVRRVVEDAIITGHTVQTAIDGSHHETVESTMGAMFSVDTEKLYIYELCSPSPVGWVIFVYGNSGWDVIADYADNPHMRDLLAGAFALADHLTEKLTPGTR